jgi:uncharacterized protein (TIGR00369 family)
MDAARTRTYTWEDPGQLAKLIAGRSGLEALRAVVAGDIPLPPIMHTLGARDFQVEEGRVSLLLDPREFHYNPLGTVHGGVLATLLDTGTGCAVHSVLPAGVGYTSLDLNARFLRPATVDSGTLRCEGTVVSQGRRTALAESRITDSAGRLIAHATSSCMLFATESAAG